VRGLRDQSFENFYEGGRLLAWLIERCLAMVAYPCGLSDTHALVRRIKF
jgi:hypothetical protein